MSSRFVTWILCLLLVLATAGQSPALGFVFKKPQIDAITFHAAPGKLFVPVQEAESGLGLSVQRDDSGQVVQIGTTVVKPGTLRRLVDGTELLSTDDLANAGAEVAAPTPEGTVIARKGWRKMALAVPPQRIEVSLAKQRLQGWQGNRLVVDTNISSGRNGGTPAGEFKAGPYRSKLHRSSLYNNAPMPWSVQIRGHIFLHGFTSVPSYPASHGCIRIPLTGGNPARFIYEWVLTGTPVSVVK